MPDNKYLNEIRRIVESGLCHRCGACSGICPEGVIAPRDDYYPDWKHTADKCIQCGLCVAVCPGREFSFSEYRRRLFGTYGEPNIIGTTLKNFLGYASDPEIRRQSTSGGIATQLPLFLLKKKKVRGAILVRNNPSVPWKPVATLARTESEIKEAMLSKYPACSLNHLFRELRTERGPFVVVGLPCHIHGLRKMMALTPALEDKIALSIGLFCHSCLEHDAILDMLNYYHIESSSLMFVRYRYGKLCGGILAGLKNGDIVELPFPWMKLGNKWRPIAPEIYSLLFLLYSPIRCRMCIDALAEFADISVGDPWVQNWFAMPPELNHGYNFIMARTAKGLKVLDEAEEAGEIVLQEYISPNSLKAPACHKMVSQKRARGMYYIEQRARKGVPYPDYSFHTLMNKWQKLKAGLHVATHFASDRPRLRRLIAYVLLSPVGVLIWRIIFLKKRLEPYFGQKCQKSD